MNARLEAYRSKMLTSKADRAGVTVAELLRRSEAALVVQRRAMDIRRDRRGVAWPEIERKALAHQRWWTVVHVQRWIVIWDTDGNDSVVFWAGETSGYDGQGWTDDRREAVEFFDKDEADAALKAANRSFADNRRRYVAVEEVEPC